MKTSPATALLASTLLIGCVSSKKYTKLESDSKALATQLADAKTANEALTKQLEEQKTTNTSLSQQASESAERENQYKDVVNRLLQEVQDGNVKVTRYQNMLTVDVAEKLFFASGSATLKKGGETVLSKVGDVLNKYNDKIIRVVGHTDNVPISKNFQNIFPTNWELSAMRATNVVRYLQEKCGTAPERLIASGRGEYEPIAPNDTIEGRQKNRRIEIMLVDKSMLEAMAGAKAKTN